MHTQATHFDDILQMRRSVRKFDTEATVPDEVIQRSLERAILAPNSSNMQLWQFIWVRSEEKRKALVPLCFGQNAAKTSAHLVVFLTRRAWWRKHANWNMQQAENDPQNASHPKRIQLMKKYYGKLMPLVYRQDPFGFSSLVRFLISFFAGLFRPMARFRGAADQRVMLHKSCALAAQNFMLSITAEGFATCPMEGFDRVRVHKALGLPRDAEICMIIAVGKGTEEGIYGERRRLPLSEVLKVV